MELSKLEENLKKTEKNLRRVKTLGIYWSRKFESVKNSKFFSIFFALEATLLEFTIFLFFLRFGLKNPNFLNPFLGVWVFAFLFVFGILSMFVIKQYCRHKENLAGKNERTLLFIKEIQAKSINEFILGSALVHLLEKRSDVSLKTEELKDLAKTCCYQIAKENSN